jgi:hypothetical protein
VELENSKTSNPFPMATELDDAHGQRQQRDENTEIQRRQDDAAQGQNAFGLPPWLVYGLRLVFVYWLLQFVLKRL